MSEEKDTTNKGMFGITSETKASNNAPLLVATEVKGNPQFPSGWRFPIARLVNIVSTPEFEKKDGAKVAVLQFIFKDKDGRQHNHTEWEVDDGDTKFKEKKDGLDVRIKHIYTTIFGQFPEKGIGTEATSWGEFFSLTEQAFNNITIGEGDEKKKVYPTIPLYYKLTYYKARMNFPLSPNFLERFVKDKPCKTLTINTTYDKLQPTVSGGGRGIPGVSGGGTIDDLPSFDQEYQ